MANRNDYPVAGDTYTIYIALTPAGGGDTFQASPTIAAGDFQILEDGSFVNLDNTPSVVDTNVVQIVVSATETTDIAADDKPIVIFGHDASGAEWQDVVITAGIRSAANATATALATVDTVVDAIKAVTDELPDSGALTSLATAAALTTVDGIVDDILTDTGTTIPAQITGLNNLSAAQVNAEVDTALADYDGPTAAELTAGLAALNDPTAAEIRAEIDANSTQLAAIVADTNELQTDDIPGAIAALNNLSAAEVNAEVDTALADYDAPTAAELTAAVAPLATAAAVATVDANVDSILADTGTDGVVISTATAQAIADAILARGVDNVEDSADPLSLTELVLATLESAVSGTTWTIRKSGGDTFSTRTVTVDADADPVTGVT